MLNRKNIKELGRMDQ